jgi:hypothetical protein
MAIEDWAHRLGFLPRLQKSQLGKHQGYPSAIQPVVADSCVYTL